MAFVHAVFTIVEKTLQPGESLKVDTGCLVAFTKNVQYNVQFVGGIKTPCLEEKECFLQMLLT